MDTELIVIGTCMCGHSITFKEMLQQNSEQIKCNNCGRDNLVRTISCPTEEEYYSIKNSDTEDDLPF